MTEPAMSVGSRIAAEHHQRMEQYAHPTQMTTDMNLLAVEIDRAISEAKKMSKPEDKDVPFVVQPAELIIACVSLRDWFAGQYLGGDQPIVSGFSEKQAEAVCKEVAKAAYAVADAMLEARQKAEK